MFNFSNKKNKEELTDKESVKSEDDESLKSVPETPEPPKQVIDLEGLENQPKMQDFGSDEPLPERPKSPEKESSNFQVPEDDDVSFEVPDFTEDDINMNIDLKDIAGIKDGDSKASSEADDDLNSKELDTPLPDESTPDDSFAEEEPEKEEVLEEPEKEEVLEDFAEEEPEKEEVLEEPEETEDESSEDLPSFDSNDDDSWEGEKDEPLPKFEVKDYFGPKFLSKNMYKQLVSSLMSFEKTLDNTTDLSEEFTKNELSVKKHSKDLEKNISLIKEKMIEVDKKIFI